MYYGAFCLVRSADIIQQLVILVFSGFAVLSQLQFLLHAAEGTLPDYYLS